MIESSNNPFTRAIEAAGLSIEPHGHIQLERIEPVAAKATRRLKIVIDVDSVPMSWSSRPHKGESTDDVDSVVEAQQRKVREHTHKMLRDHQSVFQQSGSLDLDKVTLKVTTRAFRAVECNVCDSFGRRPCGRCSGRGEINENCPRCSGTREINCSRCHGQGSRPCPKGCSFGRIYCRTCRGSGKHGQQPVYRQDGLMHYVQSTCTACHGRGSEDCTCSAGRVDCDAFGCRRGKVSCNGPCLGTGRVSVSCGCAAGKVACDACEGDKVRYTGMVTSARVRVIPDGEQAVECDRHSAMIQTFFDSPMSRCYFAVVAVDGEPSDGMWLTLEAAPKALCVVEVMHASNQVLALTDNERDVVLIGNEHIGTMAELASAEEKEAVLKIGRHWHLPWDWQRPCNNLRRIPLGRWLLGQDEQEAGTALYKRANLKSDNELSSLRERLKRRMRRSRLLNLIRYVLFIDTAIAGLALYLTYDVLTFGNLWKQVEAHMAGVSTTVLAATAIGVLLEYVQARILRWSLNRQRITVFDADLDEPFPVMICLLITVMLLVAAAAAIRVAQEWPI